MAVENSEDSDSVNNDDIPSSSKRAKITESTQEFVEDRLSALPDSLLLHILSSVCTKQAAQTCLLSKRWQFLWTDLPVLDLRETSREVEVIRSFVDCVGRILVMCSGTNLNKLSIDFWYKKGFASNVNLWVHFAVKNKVKDFTLYCRSSSMREVYVLPQMLYSNVYFTTLSVGYCDFPKRVIEWGYLKSLLLECVVVMDYVIHNIMSGCPTLEVLQISKCYGSGELDFSSPSLTTLVIDDWRNAKTYYSLKILAPYVSVLSVSASSTMKFIVRHTSSLVTAKVDYIFPGHLINATSAHVDKLLLPHMKELLDSFQSVKELELGPLGIEVLASLEETGWNILPSTRLCLTLTAWKLKRSIFGILQILKSSPNLETLVIRWTGFECQLISVCHNQAAARPQNGNLDLILPLLRHLKNVNISGFSELGLAGEPILTLVKLLLKRAPSLETMVISANDLTGYSPNSCSSTDFTKIALKLLSLPRSSPNAVVLFR